MKATYTSICSTADHLSQDLLAWLLIGHCFFALPFIAFKFHKMSFQGVTPPRLDTDGKSAASGQAPLDIPAKWLPGVATHVLTTLCAGFLRFGRSLWGISQPAVPQRLDPALQTRRHGRISQISSQIGAWNKLGAGPAIMGHGLSYYGAAHRRARLRHPGGRHG